MSPKIILHKIRYIGSVLVLIFCLWACENSSNQKSKVNTVSEKLDLVKSHSGLKDSLLFSTTFSFHNKLKGLGIYSSRDSTWLEYYVLQGHWQKLKSSRFKNIGKILKAQAYPIQDSTFIALISLNPKRGPASTLYFSLLDPEKFIQYSIHFRYFQNVTNLASKYQMEDSLKKHRRIWSSLEKLSAKYALENDRVWKNPGIKDSMIKRWVMLNDRVYEETSSPGKSFQLNSEEFQGDLAPGLRNFENNDSLFKKNVSVSENGQYKIASTIQGPVYGFNKGQNRGFILWVPDEPEHYIKTVQIRGNHVLFYDSILTSKSKFKAQYDYDLGQKIIKKLK